MKKNILTIIEITDTHVKFIQARAARGLRLVSACNIRALHHFTDEEITNALIEMARLTSVSSDHLIVLIPRRFTILKQLRLPSHEEAEIKKMAGLQLVSQIPYSLEDVIYEYSVIEKEHSGYTQVLAIVVHKDVTDRYLKLLGKMGLHPARLTLSSLGLLGWWNNQEHKSKGTGQALHQKGAGQVVGLINIDSAQTEICFFHQKNLLFSRSINYGAKDLKGDNLTGLLSQMELSLQAYAKENMGPAMTKIVVLSSSPEAVVLKEKLAEKFPIPMEIMSPAENIPLQKGITLPAGIEEQGISLAAGFGILTGEIKKSVNLLPAEVHDTKKIKHRKQQWIQFIFLFLLTSSLGFSILGIKYLRTLKVWQGVDEQAEKLKSKAAEAKKTIEFFNSFDQKFKERVFAADLIEELYTLTPEDISFRSLQLDERGLFTIQGYAEAAGSVNSFQARLLKSPAFKEVNLQFATKRKIFNMEVTDFKITCQLNNGAGVVQGTKQ